MALDFDPTVVILTHADADHVGGAVNFFPDLALKDLAFGRAAVRQLWVPSEWGLLAFCLTKMAESALDSAINVEDPQAPIITPVVIYERELDDNPSGPLPCFRMSEPRNDDQIREDAKKNADNVLTQFLSAKVSLKDREADIVEEIAKHLVAFRDIIDPRHTNQSKRWSGTPGEVAQRVFDQSKHILTVLRQAVECGVEIRLFSVDIPPSVGQEPFEYTGIPGHLTLINAVEVEFLSPTVHALAATLLRADRLTLQNRRALVTFVWPTKEGASDGLIIWSDSDGRIAQADQRGPRTPWSLTRYMTAPHHGSKNDQHELIWCGRRDSGGDEPLSSPDRYIFPIISGDLPAPWPAASHHFKSIAPDMRACTSCSSQRRGRIRRNVPVLQMGANPVTCAVSC